MRHLHLDLVGGIAGDMFIAAVLDCFPEFEAELELAIIDAGFADLVELKCLPFNDGVLTGKRFSVREIQHQDDHNDHHHSHRHYSEIKSILENSELEVPVKDIALGIFNIIAVAEAEIHDKPVANIAFHEVGAWDSIADVVCASYLIHRARITSCSCSALPLGKGQVKTSHGMLPIPAPATALILKEFEFVDDGIPGERITPTGAAILSFLSPKGSSNGKLLHQGFGFGTKKMSGISNTLRALVFDTNDTRSDVWQTEKIHQLEFEIDDQTPEQLASAISQIQQIEDVLDIVQYTATSKKNRLTHSVRVLARSNLIHIVTESFKHTSTLGIRHSVAERYVLTREHLTVNHEQQTYRVKRANRPGGQTAKIEMDDLLSSESFATQKKLRSEIELKAEIELKTESDL